MDHSPRNIAKPARCTTDRYTSGTPTVQIKAGTDVQEAPLERGTPVQYNPGMDPKSPFFGRTEPWEP